MSFNKNLNDQIVKVQKKLASELAHLIKSDDVEKELSTVSINDVKEAIKKSLNDLLDRGIISLGEEVPPEVKVNMLWDTWDKDKQEVWNQCNLYNPEVGEDMRFAVSTINSLNGVNADSMENYLKVPDWAILDPQEIMACDVFIKPVIGVDFINTNAELKEE